MRKVSINSLAQYSERMSTPDLPTDKLSVTFTRAERDWFAKDLIKRKKRLSQAVSDPKTRQSKREKRQSELYMLSATLDKLQEAVKVDT
ncbi:MAG: hypothetical protein HDS16_04830 [Bacteroides sp.]|nr:hypothetical protein [Bacteroides sp.]